MNAQQCESVQYVFIVLSINGAETYEVTKSSNELQSKIF